MEFINQAVTVLQTLVVALGAGLAVWGVVSLYVNAGQPRGFVPQLRLCGQVH